MFFSLTFNSAVWILVGIGLILTGLYFGYKMRLYPYAVGLLSLGSGCVACGLTNGFTDHSPKTQLLRKFGKFALIIGVPITAYYTYLFFGQ